MRVISCDGHIVEPLEALPRGARYEGRSRQLLVLGEGYDCPALPVWTSVGVGTPGIGAGFEQPLGLDDCPGAFDPAVRGTYCELKGVGAEVLYPTFAGVAVEMGKGAREREWAAQRYNVWAFATFKWRLQPLWLCAALEPEGLAEEFKAAAVVKALGVLLPQEMTQGLRWRDCKEEFALAAERGLPIHWHAFTRPSKDSFGKDPLALAWEAVRPAQDILLELILGGVFKEVPNLKVVFAEFDIGWVPHLAVRLKRLVDRYGKLAGSPLGHADVYDALKQCYFVAQSTIEIQYLGQHVNGLWGWDYPHSDAVGVPSGAEEVMRGLNTKAVELYPRLEGCIA